MFSIYSAYIQNIIKNRTCNFVETIVEIDIEFTLNICAELKRGRVCLC